MKYISGRGSKDGISIYLNSLDISDYDIEKLGKEFNSVKRDLMEEHLDKEVFLIPGIEKFLEYLSKNNRRRIVVTSSRYDYVKKSWDTLVSSNILKRYMTEVQLKRVSLTQRCSLRELTIQN